MRKLLKILNLWPKSSIIHVEGASMAKQKVEYYDTKDATGVVSLEPVYANEREVIDQIIAQSKKELLMQQIEQDLIENQKLQEIVKNL